MSIWRISKKVSNRVDFSSSKYKNIINLINITNSRDISEVLIYINKIIIEEINDLKIVDLDEDSLKFPGVYILKILNDIKYIGSSRYLFNEINTSIWKYEKRFKENIESIDVYITNNYEDADFLERYLINIYKPRGNVIICKIPTLNKTIFNRILNF